MSFLKRLNEAQNELKAPKGQYNSFGKYNYRSAEDILDAVKPINKKYELHLEISDEIKVVGERIYVQATCTLRDVKGEFDPIVVTAFAREPLNKKGMDESQITGAASSYARKYALNGLYLIDDTKDVDTNEHRNQQNNAPTKKQPPKVSIQEAGDLNKKIDELSDLLNEKDGKQKLTRWLIGEYAVGGNKISDIYKKNYNKAMVALNKMIKNNQPKENQDSLFEGNTTIPKEQK